MIHHLPHRQSPGRAEEALEFSLREIPTGAGLRDCVQTGFRDLDDARTPILWVHFDRDEAVSFQRLKIVAHRGSVHRYELRELTHWHLAMMLEIAKDRELG